MSSNGLSLRKKKSSKDAPRRKSLFDGRPPEVSSKEKNKVQDRIKRRLSTKISPPMIGLPGQPLPANAMQNINNHRTPIIPQEARQQHQQRQKEKQDASSSARSQPHQRPAFDPTVFRDPNFNADAYVKQMLASASPEELDEFYRLLRENGEATNDLMQKNVFNNYKEFIIISQEIGTIQADMADLRDSLSELQNITTTLTEDSEAAIAAAEAQPISNGASPAISGTPRRGQRNSIVDFHQLNKYHLQALWQQVEGSQKFLPADEGRRIVRESGAWMELNAATWRPRGKVHLVLLNDHLLVAAKRPKPSGSGHRLIAEHCFPLQEIRLSSFEEEGMEDAISVRLAGSREKYAFRATTMEEKVVMLKAAKHELAELQASLRERGEQLAQQGDTHAMDVSRSTQIKRLSRRLSRQAGVDSPQADAEVDLEVVRERIDELDQCIAHRQFKQAVRSIGRGRQLVQESGPDDLAAQLTALQLDERAEQLARLLAIELAAESQKPHAVVRLARFLVALGAGAQARRAYLDAQAVTIRQRSKQVSFDADLPIYLSDVATVTFHLIKQAACAYLHAFTNIVLPNAQANASAPLGTNKDLFTSMESASATSAFVAWSAAQVEQFAKLFNAQTWGLEPDSETYRECLEAVSRQMAILRDVGMDLHCAAQRSLGTSTKASA